MIQEIANIQEFKELTKTHKGLNVIMFGGQFCGYCKMMKPIFKQLSEDEDLENYTFNYIDRDLNRDLVEEFGFDIPTIPRFFAVEFNADGKFSEKNILNKIGGSQPKSEFKDKLVQTAAKNSDSNTESKNHVSDNSQNSSKHNPKIAIIGSGPSGLTAAIYTSRANLDTTVYTGLQPGGQLTTTTEIENFPGAWSSETKQGEMGPDLMMRIQQQAQHFGAKMVMDEVKSLTHENSKFKLGFSGDRAQIFDAVIIASGASARYLGIAGEEKYVGKGYHSCATCDGFFYRDKEVIIVGGGDSAMEEAGFLAKFAKRVYLINRSKKFRASKIMLDRAKQNSKIEIITDTVIKEFIGDDKVDSVTLENTLSHETTNMPIDGVFVAIGHIPNSGFVGNLLEKDNAGYLIPQRKVAAEYRVSKYGTATKIPGLFVAGDIEDTTYRQAITAAGDGCQAAMDLEKWLED